MKMIITKDTAVNMENITALEVDVEYSEYKLETGEIEKVKNPVGCLWAKTTGSAVILKTIWERTAEGITYTEEEIKLGQKRLYEMREERKRFLLKGDKLSKDLAKGY